ncbi:MAG: gliding motility protein GldL [Bacteroidales bacterium]|nr:gliding motility protein GldL [Bacteroidales bacterium]
MGIDTLVRSKAYKEITAKLYGVGASIVIVGALFKINHWPFATELLIVGMLTEAVIFFFSAFEPLHVTYDWSLVYPELAGMEGLTPQEEDEKKRLIREQQKANPSAFGDKKGEGGINIIGGTSGDIVLGGMGASATQELDKMLENAKIGPELIESLGKGLQRLSDTAEGLSSVASAAETSDKFIQNVSQATESVNDLNAAYKKTAEYLNKDLLASGEYLASVQEATSAVSTLANIYNETAKTLSVGDASYIDELKTMASSLSSINALYKMQIENSAAQLESTKNVQERIDNLVVNFADTAENVLRYKEQVNALSKKVGSLNDIYGNMLAAMQVKG